MYSALNHIIVPVQDVNTTIAANYLHKLETWCYCFYTNSI
jgi:hypothetical protein